jgi:hypothetical protein
LPSVLTGFFATGFAAGFLGAGLAAYKKDDEPPKKIVQGK